MKKTKSLKVYATIGKVLCGIAGGIVGFFLGGPVFVVPGIVAGVISGHFFNKSILPSAS